MIIQHVTDDILKMQCQLLPEEHRNTLLSILRLKDMNQLDEVIAKNQELVIKKIKDILEAGAEDTVEVDQPDIDQEPDLDEV